MKQGKPFGDLPEDNALIASCSPYTPVTEEDLKEVDLALGGEETELEAKVKSLEFALKSQASRQAKMDADIKRLLEVIIRKLTR